MARCFVVFLFALCYQAGAAQPGDGAKELDKLQGTWDVSALVLNGREEDAALLRARKMVIKGDKMTMLAGDTRIEYSIKLDPTKMPGHLDFTGLTGPSKGRINTCIYQLNGNTLKVCVPDFSKGRPEKFAAPPGSLAALFTWTRAKN